jgi:hypothetical protein
VQHPRGNCFPITDSSPSTGASQFPKAMLSSNGEQTRRWATGRAGVPCVAGITLNNLLKGVPCVQGYEPQSRLISLVFTDKRERRQIHACGREETLQDH